MPASSIPRRTFVSEVAAAGMAVTWPVFAEGGQLWIGDKPRLLDEAKDAALRAYP